MGVGPGGDPSGGIVDHIGGGIGRNVGQYSIRDFGPAGVGGQHATGGSSVMGPTAHHIGCGGGADGRAGAEVPFAETGCLDAGGAGIGDDFWQGEFRSGESIGGSSTDDSIHPGAATVAAGDKAGAGGRAHRAGPGIGEPDAGSGEALEMRRGSGGYGGGIVERLAVHPEIIGDDQEHVGTGESGAGQPQQNEQKTGHGAAGVWSVRVLRKAIRAAWSATLRFRPDPGCLARVGSRVAVRWMPVL